MDASALLEVLLRTGNFTAYHAIYLALAEALEAPLLTRDRRLATAATRYVHVELV